MKNSEGKNVNDFIKNELGNSHLIIGGSNPGDIDRDKIQVPVNGGHGDRE